MKILTKLLFTFITLTVVLLSVSCTTYTYKPEKLELRQMVQKTETTTGSQCSFFLVVGSYSKETNTTYTVKMFAKVNGYFRVIDAPLNKIRINIDENIEKPFLLLESDKVNFNVITTDNVINSDLVRLYIITCPSKYLPEQLIPITL